MGVKIRKLRGKWYLVIDYRGKRKTRVIGTDRKIAEEVRRQVEAKLALAIPASSVQSSVRCRHLGLC